MSPTSGRPDRPRVRRPRARLNRDRVLRTAVAFADGNGIDALSMRNLAQELGVVPMALYKHVANREELLDGMVGVIVDEIALADDGGPWKASVRAQALSAREAVLRHPWARGVIESRSPTTAPVLAYMDSMAGLFRSGGFSVDLTHHVMHAFGFRMWGFSQEMFDAAVDGRPDVGDAELSALADRYPHILSIAMEVEDRAGPFGEGGCDARFEFEFALDVLLDGFERLLRQGWSSSAPSPGRAGDPPLRGAAT